MSLPSNTTVGAFFKFHYHINKTSGASRHFKNLKHLWSTTSASHLLALLPPESEWKESVSVGVRSGAGHQKPGVQSKGRHAGPRYAQRTPSTHTHARRGVKPEESSREQQVRRFVVSGTEGNATVMGEKDPVDEVQGFLFGKLKWVKFRVGSGKRTDLFLNEPYGHFAVTRPSSAHPFCSLTRTVYPELKEQLKELRKHLVESTNDMAPLKVWQMQGGSPNHILLQCFCFYSASC